MQFVDSHCHINFEPLGHDTAGILERAHDNNVGYMLCVSVCLEDYPEVAALAADHPNIFSSVGVHPNYRDCHEPTVPELVELATHPEVVAVGETGLDYFRSAQGADWQKKRFENHIEAARIVGKPLIIHTRSAAGDTMDMLESLDAESCKGVMHCFSEDWDTARRALDIGFYISFSGVVTFKNAQSLRDVAVKIPDDRILVETDAPYLAPVPFRGETNEPSMVRYTAECLADLRNTDLADFAHLTTENFFTLFSSANRLGN